MPLRVLITDALHHSFMTKMKEKGIAYDYQPEIQQEELREIIGNYEAVIINSKITMDQDMLDRAQKLRFIGRAGSGLEIIDTGYAAQKGIQYANSPSGNRDSVGEHTVALILNLLHNVSKADREIRQWQWNREENRGEELREKTVGILGFGQMGTAVAEKLYGLGPRVIAYDKYKSRFSNLFAEEVSREQFLSETEILSIHLPLTDETKWLIDKDYLQSFARLKYVVNTARGKNLVTSDLLTLLSQGALAGAALDVLEEENPHKFSKNFERDFKNLIKNDKLVVSPHIAGWSNESKKKIAEVLAVQLTEGLL